ncbi:hypothetical protein SAMN05444395_103181 [Flavobacterium fryxellicola]|uniref:TonB-dependent receptor n=1 Tax=Flavobacterium fryxellicola TaxID=249352 RepID=A0A167X3P4_9FLAO|nr:hypothetical protein [Flavobacterium fryxellicola]OAB28000.1 hypothetical protein FBFR_09095 [Flavobacterium fryxellicola]SHN64968.1 hypothetical protein SAMN05444395_103181 [Flavobacterium fryxellicola]
MLKIVYLFLVFAAANVLAQQQPPMQLKGKVTADASVLAGVYVINKKTDKVSITSQNGDFNIQAAVGDTLLFAAAQFNEMKMSLTQKDFDQGILLVKMIPTINELREVVVRNDINAAAMGIISKGQKTYTPAERKLYTATDLNASATAGTMMGGSVSADPVLNWISGRTKMLKKEVEVEKKEMYLRQLENLFTIDYFIYKLKIPSEYVKGFQYYSVENEQFVAVLKSKNGTMATFLLGELALKYKQIIASEN